MAKKTSHLPCHDKVDAKLTLPFFSGAIKEPAGSTVEAVECVDYSFLSKNEAMQGNVALDHKSCPESLANAVENRLVEDRSFDSVDRLCTFYSDLFVNNFKKPTRYKTQHHMRTSGSPRVAKI